MSLKEIKAHQQTFLKNQKARTKSAMYTIQGIEISVHAGVFPPATDTKLLVSHIKVAKGVRVLDLTTGSGITSIVAGLQGATGIAVDINPKAIENAIENFSRYEVKMNTILSNLFQNVPVEKFDQIYANGPFIEGKITDTLDYSCYGAKEFMRNFLINLKQYLKPTGYAFIVLAEWSDMDYFNKLVSENNLRVAWIDKKLSDDKCRKYNLFKVSL
ncbi:MAG: methyltransferase [Candidatus Pacebacteria bacterium]|nr:methyltransferase [Candidatus Paceibacterota bacterium]